MTPPDWYGRALGLVAALIIVFLCMAGVAANAQDHPYWSGNADEWTLERIDPDRYQVSYYNSDPPASFGSPRFLQMGDMRVGLDLEMTSGPEYLTVTPPDGWLAIPPVIEVQDGQTGSVDVIRASEWQGM